MTANRRAELIDMVVQSPLWVLALGLTFLPLIIAPWVTRVLDARGLPGFGVALALILVGPAIAAYFYVRETGSLHRARERKRDADRLGLHFTRRFSIPTSMLRVPSLAGMDVGTSARRWGVALGVANLVSGRAAGDEIVSFDFWAKDDTPYAPVVWRTLVAVSTTLEAEPVIIEPRHTSLGKGQGLKEMNTESIAFDRAYRVWASDARFASTLLDQRMIAWLLEAESAYALQVGGGWAAVVAPRLQGAELDGAIDLVRAFRSHVPRVVSSIYPRSDPGFS